MILIVGLGNPGRKFQKTRHNIGFRIIDELVRKYNFPKFKILKELSEGLALGGRGVGGLDSLISEGKFNGQEVILAKPQTFMNLSGKSVKLLVNFYRIRRPGLIVTHDDIDIQLGKIRISKGRGAAGHKGVESIINEFGTKNFIRFRIGIRPRSTISTIVENVEKFVLLMFNKEEEKIVVYRGLVYRGLVYRGQTPAVLDQLETKEYFTYNRR